MECSVCKWKNQVSCWRKEMLENIRKDAQFSHVLYKILPNQFQVPIKRTKHFELGGEKKRKGQMIQF